MRLSIEVSPEQHQQLKAVAALSDQSIKDYVLDRVLPDEEDEALQQLERFLEPRLKESSINKSVKKIFEETHQEMR